jgi:FAD/FMN-containing dehydrogenase
MPTPLTPGPLAGRLFSRGDAGYEAARRATMWNARRPDRFPDVIVQARDVHDVVAAVRLARARDLRIGVRSGGHSWSANHVRDGGLLLDVSRLADVTIDAAARRATAGPGVAGHDLAGRLVRRGLFFPAGHCIGVKLGGYLLQGGFGWNSRALGPACHSVVGLDVVTADGDLVHASADDHADLYWAARGAGAGFFGVVVRYHLRLYPRPAAIGFGLLSYPLDRAEEVLRWAHAIGHDVPATVELQLLMSRRGALGRPSVDVFAPVFADGQRAAWRDLRLLRDAPPRPALRIPYTPAPLSLMYRAVMHHYPQEHRYAVDNMWTRASMDALWPGLRRIADTLPSAPSHALWLNWAPPPRRAGEMAFSMEDDYYLALYAVWRDAADDATHAAWPVERMRELAPLATGCQLADENLGQRPARFVSDDHLARLDAIRAVRDPDGRFHPWMGRPTPAPDAARPATAAAVRP